jgi:hypothetical protein
LSTALFTVFQQPAQRPLNHTAVLTGAIKSQTIVSEPILQVVAPTTGTDRYCGERNVTIARSAIRTGFVRRPFPGINGAARESIFAPILCRYDTGERGISSAPT